MGCNCDCYCGCATRSNRVKYLASGVLFCVWCLLQFYTFEQVQACQDNYPPECAVHDVRLDRGHLGTAPGLWNGTGGRGDPSIPVMCEEAYGKRMKCLLDKAYAPLNVFLNLLKLFALVGFIVPLGMMCCCTKSPHKCSEYHGTQMVPTGAQSAAPAEPTMQSLEVPMEPVALGKAQDKRSNSHTSSASMKLLATPASKPDSASLLDPQ